MSISWVVIFGILIKLFAPVIQQWLQDLFNSTGHSLRHLPVSADPAVFKQQLEAAFQELINNQPKIAVWRRRALKRAMHASLVRSNEILASAKTLNHDIEPIDGPDVHALKAEIQTAQEE